MLDNFNGGRLKVIKCTLWNRTGQPLSPGELVSFNTDFANVANQAMAGLNPSNSTDGATGYILGAAITPTATNIKMDMAVVDDTVDGSDIPDDAQFTAILSHPDFPILLEGSTGIAAGEFFVGTAAAYYGTGKTRTELGASTGAISGENDVARVVGQTWEAGSTGAAARKRCRFWGGLFPIGLYVGPGNA